MSEPEITPNPMRPLQTADGNALVARTITLRDRLDEISAEFDTRKAPIAEAMQKINEELAARLHEAGAKSLKFDAGTATRFDTQTATCHDWEAFNKWVLENQRLDMFPRKLNTTPVKEMLENEEPLPPGVQMMTQASVRIRRSAPSK